MSCPEHTPEIRIHYQGISFRTGAQQMRYRHRLVGYSPAEQWSAFTAGAVVSYGALPVGTYRFEVQTIDRDGLPSEVVGLAVDVVPDVQSERLRALSKTLQASASFVPSESPSMREVMQQVAQAAGTNLNVLVLGETGTGKGVLAQIIHATSARQGRPFIQVNCGALPSGLIESELFGHEKGAFTGADTRQLGRFELADGGTLFLDEIGALPLDAQRVLLQILEERALTRVGGQQPVPVDVRIVSATNSNLRQAIQAGTFRQDLFYRLEAFTVSLPPLRNRLEDIADLAVHFVVRYAHVLERSVPTLDAGVVARLQAHSWPGNVRELEHVMQRAVLLCAGDVLRVKDVSFSSVAPSAEEGPLPGRLRNNEPARRSKPRQPKGRRLRARNSSLWQPCKRRTGGSMAHRVPPRCWVCTRRSCVTACRNTGYAARRSSAGRKCLYRRSMANESRCKAVFLAKVAGSIAVLEPAALSLRTSRVVRGCWKGVVMSC